MNEVEFPEQRRRVLIALAELANTRARILLGDDSILNDGTIDAIWDVLVEDYPISHATQHLQTLFFVGEESENLRACGNLFDEVFQAHRDAIDGRFDWLGAVRDPVWESLEQQAGRCVVLMLWNWGFSTLATRTSED